MPPGKSRGYFNFSLIVLIKHQILLTDKTEGEKQQPDPSMHFFLIFILNSKLILINTFYFCDLYKNYNEKKIE